MYGKKIEFKKTENNCLWLNHTMSCFTVLSEYLYKLEDLEMGVTKCEQAAGSSKPVFIRMLQNDSIMEKKYSAYKALVDMYRQCYGNCFDRCDQEVISMHHKLDDQLVEAQGQIKSLGEEVTALTHENAALHEEVAFLRQENKYLQMSKDELLHMNDTMLTSERDLYLSVEQARREKAQLIEEHKTTVAKLTAVISSYITKMKDQKMELAKLKIMAAEHEHEN